MFEFFEIAHIEYIKQQMRRILASLEPCEIMEDGTRIYFGPPKKVRRYKKLKAKLKKLSPYFAKLDDVDK